MSIFDVEILQYIWSFMRYMLIVFFQIRVQQSYTVKLV